MPTTQCLLATMVTTTTYGTWLPGYVEDGVILPGNLGLLERSRPRLKSSPVYLNAGDQDAAFRALVHAAREFQYTLLGVSIESWHCHWLIDHAFDDVEVMVGRLTTRVRHALNRGRIWTSGYDARYCFDRETVEARRWYIRKHQGYRELPPR